MNEAYRPMNIRADNGEAPKTVEEAEVRRREEAMAFSVAEELLRWYPGHPWQVDVTLFTVHLGEKRPGGVQIKLPVVMPPGKGYNIPLGLLRDANSFTKYVREAGGNILERYQIPRGGCSFDHLLAARPSRRLTWKDQVPA